MKESIIEIDKLRFTYPDGTEVLRGVDLTILKGEVFGLAGLSGSGKSTLMMTVGGVHSGDGELIVNGVRVGKDTLSEVRKSVGLVFQDSADQLFCPTVQEDINFGPESYGIYGDEQKNRVDSVMSDLGITHLAERASHSLSAGERRLVAIATVLVMKPEIIILDEPFANLDYKSILSVVDIIGKIGATVIIISQDILLLSGVCDRIGIMNSGVIESVSESSSFSESVKPIPHLKIESYLALFKNHI